MADPMAMLMTLGEAGGITGMVVIVLVVAIRLIKKNGCTTKCYNCFGKPLVEVDCEEGAPGKRYVANAHDDSSDGKTEA